MYSFKTEKDFFKYIFLSDFNGWEKFGPKKLARYKRVWTIFSSHTNTSLYNIKLKSKNHQNLYPNQIQNLSQILVSKTKNPNKIIVA